jgi:large subunit ribosomal protein L18
VKHEKTVRQQRKRRGFRVRNRIKRDSTRPRLSIFRSHKNLYVQVIDDEAGKTLAQASTLDKDLKADISYGGNIAAAEKVGKAIADRALEAGVKQVAFDRREYKYHGRIAAMADAAREAGLDIGAKGAVAPKSDAKESKSKKGNAKKGAAKKGKK